MTEPTAESSYQAALDELRRHELAFDRWQRKAALDAECLEQVAIAAVRHNSITLFREVIAACHTHGINPNHLDAPTDDVDKLHNLQDTVFNLGWLQPKRWNRAAEQCVDEYARLPVVASTLKQSALAAFPVPEVFRNRRYEVLKSLQPYVSEEELITAMLTAVRDLGAAQTPWLHQALAAGRDSGVFPTPVSELPLGLQERLLRSAAYNADSRALEMLLADGLNIRGLHSLHILLTGYQEKRGERPDATKWRDAEGSLLTSLAMLVAAGADPNEKAGSWVMLGEDLDDSRPLDLLLLPESGLPFTDVAPQAAFLLADAGADTSATSDVPAMDGGTYRELVGAYAGSERGAVWSRFFDLERARNSEAVAGSIDVRKSAKRGMSL